MADMRKVEEGNAVSEKRKLDLANSISETSEQKTKVKEIESDSNKKQKLETDLENEANISSFLIRGTTMEVEDGKKDSKANEKDDEDEHLNVEGEMVDRATRFSAAEKGKGVLLEESDEEYDYDDDDSDDSDDDFSDGLDSGSEDIPF